MDEMRQRIDAMVRYVFRQCDLMHWSGAEARIQKIIKMCMDDIDTHPDLLNELRDDANIEFFVRQTMLYAL